MNPGDQAPPGTPGSSEDLCPRCSGKSTLDGTACETCGGTGKASKAWAVPDAKRTEREKMVAGDPYDAYDPELVQARRRARMLCRSLETADDEAERRSLLRSLLLACPDTTEIVGAFRCDYGWNVSFAPHCFVNFGCVILDVCPVAIGEYTLLGPSVHIYTAAHPLDAAERRLREFGRPVTIGNDVWLGGGVIVCPGVAIGDRSVIGAGSVVTRDIPADCVAAGNPCRIVRKLGNGMS